MKKIIFSISLLYTIFSYSQLFVASNSYMYVGNQFVFVKQNTQLESDGQILLRREGQFLQGTAVGSANLGEGKLSVYQEGTTDNFAYNYWCSPVGNPSNNVGNENFGITMLEQPVSVLDSDAAIMLAMNVNNGLSNPLSIAPRWIHRFLSGVGYSNWILSGSNNDIVAGQGFTMKGTYGPLGTLDGFTPTGESSSNNPGNAQRYDFRGKPNDGEIPITVDTGKWTLTGNPYPSAIDLSLFLEENLNCTGVAYFWEHDKDANSHIIYNYRGGYGTYSPISRSGGTGVYIPAVFYTYDLGGISTGTYSSPLNDYSRYFSPVGQGFMIEGSGAGSTVLMKNDYRVFTKENAVTSVFERNSDNSENDENEFLPYTPSVSGFDYTTVRKGEAPNIKINTLLNGQGVKQFVVAFDDQATDGIDHAKDAKNANTTANDINFLIDNKDCILSVIQFDENKRLPLSIKATQNASFKVAVNQIVNFNPSQNVYLYDAETNLYHDIKNSEYEFVLPQGEYKTRYEITFKNEMLSNNSNVKNNIVIYQNNAQETLFVSNPNNIDIRTINLYDINGKRISSKEKLSTENEYRISTSGLADATYIVEVFTSDNSKLTQKVIISQGK